MTDRVRCRARASYAMTDGRIIWRTLSTDGTMERGRPETATFALDDSRVSLAVLAGDDLESLRSHEYVSVDTGGRGAYEWVRPEHIIRAHYFVEVA